MIAQVVVGTILVFLAVPSYAFAQAPPADPIFAGYMRFYSGDEAGAQQHFEGLRAANAQSLPAWLGLLFVMQSRIDDEESLKPVFERGIDALIASAEQRYARSKADSEALFHLTLAHLLRGIYRVEHDRGMWGAARDAAKAKGYSDEYLKKHPEHGDAYVALGLYNYYVDIAPNFIKVLRILLFLPSGNRVEGLKQLEKAGRDGSLLAPVAQGALAEIYGSLEGRLSDAIPIAERLVQRFPANAGMRFNLAQMYMHPTVEAYESAAQQYAAVIERSTGSSQQQLADRYRATLGLANLRRTQWRLEDAIALLKPVIDQNVDKPAWVMPEFLLRRANYRMLLNDAGAADDAKRVRDDKKMATHFKAANRQLEAIAQRGRSNEAAIYAALIPGNRLVVADRFDEAKAIYDRVGASAPGDWQVRYRLAYLEFARGNYPAAATGFTSIVGTNARVPAWLKAAAMLNLAWTHDIAGRRAEALKLYKRVVDEHENEAAAGSAQIGLIAPYRGPVKRA